jgi:hypothetical protein
MATGLQNRRLCDPAPGEGEYGFWEALFMRLLPNDYFIHVMVTSTSW